MFKGDALEQTWLHVGPFYQTQGQVVSVDTGDAINFRFHAEGNPGTVHFTKTRAGGGITVGTSGFYVADDLITVKFDAADTNARAVGDYEYQLEVVYGGTDPVVVAAGTIELRERA